jgi:hypothetical protein
MQHLVGSATFGLAPVPVMPAIYLRSSGDPTDYHATRAFRAATPLEGAAPAGGAARHGAEGLGASLQLQALPRVNWWSHIQRWSRALSHRV